MPIEPVNAMELTMPEVRAALAAIRRDATTTAHERSIARTQERCERKWPDLKKETK